MQRLEHNALNVYIVEHLDPELGPWSALEYQTIAEESEKAGVKFCLSSVPEHLDLTSKLRANKHLVIEHRSVEDIFQSENGRVCLLDPAAKDELKPDDGRAFDVFLFGGILGMKLTA